MRVIVKLKAGGKFHRRENGRLVSYTEHSNPFSVSQHVYQSFNDRFVAVGEAPELPAGPAGGAADTDDDPILTLVDKLAGVGIEIPAAIVRTWTAAEVGRAESVVDRKGKGQLPTFIKAAMESGK